MNNKTTSSFQSVFCVVPSALLALVVSTGDVLAHEAGQNIPIDCSTEVIRAMVLEDGAMVWKDQRRTHFSVPISVVESHFNIPEDTGFAAFQLPVVAVGTGDISFRDTVSIPIRSEGGIIQITDPFGVPWPTVSEDEKNAKIETLECYIVY